MKVLLFLGATLSFSSTAQAQTVYGERIDEAARTVTQAVSTLGASQSPRLFGHPDSPVYQETLQAVQAIHERPALLNAHEACRAELDAGRALAGIHLFRDAVRTEFGSDDLPTAFPILFAAYLGGECSVDVIRSTETSTTVAVRHRGRTHRINAALSIRTTFASHPEGDAASPQVRTEAVLLFVHASSGIQCGRNVPYAVRADSGTEFSLPVQAAARDCLVSLLP